MVQKNQIESLIDQVRELLSFTNKNIGGAIKGDLPQDIDQQLNKLQRDVDAFCKGNKEILQKAGMREDVIQGIIRDPESHVNPSHVRMLQKVDTLKRELEALKNEISVAISVKKAKEGLVGKKGSVASKKIARKKKFKRVGGKDGWIPL